MTHYERLAQRDHDAAEEAARNLVAQQARNRRRHQPTGLIERELAKARTAMRDAAGRIKTARRMAAC